MVIVPGCFTQGGGRPGPDNPWALCGLLASLEAIGADAADIAETKAALEAASVHADVEIKASCACAAKAGGCGCADKANI